MEVLRSLTTVFCPAPDYFSAYLGEYRNVLSALETLNAAVLAAMDKTKLVRTAPGEGCRAPGWEIGAVLSSAAGGVKFGAGRQQTHQIKGVLVLSACTGSAAATQPGGWGAKPGEGKGKSKAFVLWRHHLPLAGLWQRLFQQLPAGSCPRTLWEHHWEPVLSSGPNPGVSSRQGGSQ